MRFFLNYTNTLLFTRRAILSCIAPKLINPNDSSIRRCGLIRTIKKFLPILISCQRELESRKTTPLYTTEREMFYNTLAKVTSYSKSNPSAIQSTHHIIWSKALVSGKALNAVKLLPILYCTWKWLQVAGLCSSHEN